MNQKRRSRTHLFPPMRRSGYIYARKAAAQAWPFTLARRVSSAVVGGVPSAVVAWLFASAQTYLGVEIGK